MEGIDGKIREFFTFGSGYGDGSGYGYGDGYGSGAGSCYGITSFNGETVYLIDTVMTIIRKIRGNVARGMVVNGDLTLSPCVVVRDATYFAHGRDIKTAMSALRKKQVEDMDIDELADEFVKKYPDPKKHLANKTLFRLHGELTGSCEMGRETFCKNNGLDSKRGYTTIARFLELTRAAYGNDVIQAIAERYERRADNGQNDPN